ncbi:uncharacterized protein [Periplaneta americana]|uniref:uncharacterized protein n=1 Tax=Periplaneta americana TaxID=6978 RepID=UPI0037E7445D
MAESSEKTDESSSINLQQLYRLFDKDKLNIISFLQYMKLLSQRYSCPVCNDDMSLVKRAQVSDGYEWQCTKRRRRGPAEEKHRVTRSLRKGTWFSQSKLTLEEITLLMYFWVQELPQKFVMEETKMSCGTVCDWYSFCREVCDVILAQKDIKIGGKRHIVEIDEAPFTKRQYHKGKRSIQKWVFGGIDRETGACFLHPVESRSALTLLSIVQERILPGTTIYSSCWKQYGCLSHEGFKKLTEDQCITFKDKETCSQTSTIEGLWELVKDRMLPKNRRPHFDSYLCEFMYRRSRGENDRFKKFMQDIAAVYPPPTHD